MALVDRDELGAESQADDADADFLVAGHWTVSATVFGLRSSAFGSGYGLQATGYRLRAAGLTRALDDGL
jgi:hypothetical protein